MSLKERKCWEVMESVNKKLDSQTNGECTKTSSKEQKWKTKPGEVEKHVNLQTLSTFTHNCFFALLPTRDALVQFDSPGNVLIRLDINLTKSKSSNAQKIWSNKFDCKIWICRIAALIALIAVSLCARMLSRCEASAAIGPTASDTQHNPTETTTVGTVGTVGTMVAKISIRFLLRFSTRWSKNPFTCRIHRAHGHKDSESVHCQTLYHRVSRMFMNFVW